MIKKSTLFVLFFVSYIPLFLILAIQNIDDNIRDQTLNILPIGTILRKNIVAVILTVISVLSLIYYFIFIKINNKGGFRNPKKVIAVTNNGVEYLSYLATYIIPFVGLKFDSWNNLLATTLLFVVIGFIYTKTNLLYANPTLALFGYFIYNVTFEADEEKKVISKGKIKKGTSYRYKPIDEDLYFILNSNT